MHKGQNRWSRLSGELGQRRGIERARQRTSRENDQHAQLPDPTPPAGHTTRRRRRGR